MSTSTRHRSTKLDISSPRWSNHGKRVNVTYDLPVRVYVAEIYPLRAPNGSSVILYGHENGLTCLWKGGRLPKNAAKDPTDPADSEQLPPRNVTTSDDVIMIDDDDDDDDDDDYHEASRTQASLSPDLFDLEEEEADVLKPFDTLVDSFEVPLAAAALDIAFCPVQETNDTVPQGHRPHILSQDMVIAIACADSSVHLVTVPLAPPVIARVHKVGPSSVDGSFRDITVVQPNASTRTVPRGLALTWTNTSKPLSETEDRRSGADPQWSFLLAYHFATRSGVLRIFEITLNRTSIHSGFDSLNLVRHEHLSGVVKSISFNPAAYPSERHTQLLLADSLGVVRIYQPILTVSHLSQGGDSTSSRFDSAWFVSLRAPFDHYNGGSNRIAGVENRVHLLDAQWAFAGKCVIALLADGQWGIWDIGGVGPGRQSGLLSGNSVSTGQRISGGGITRFAIRGVVGNSQMSQPIRLPKASVGTAKPAESTKLAPMTPSTRRTKQEALFVGTIHAISPFPKQSTGGISLCTVVSEAFGSRQDETLLIWFNSELYSVPSLLSYWQHAAKTASTDDGAHLDENNDTLFGPNIDHFRGLSTGGEMITSVSQNPSPQTSALRSTRSLKSDVLVSAEHRLVLSCPMKAMAASNAASEDISSLFHPTRSQMQHLPEKETAKRVNQDMLVRGELNLHAMDKMLDSMEENRQK